MRLFDEFALDGLSYSENLDWNSLYLSSTSRVEGVYQPLDYIFSNGISAQIQELEVGSNGLNFEITGSKNPMPVFAPLTDFTINQIADYLKEGFWDWFGGRYHSFNISDSTGTGFNSSRTLLFNYEGFTNVAGAGSDADGLTLERQSLVDNALDYIGEVLNINFVSTTSTNADVDLYFSDNESGAHANFLTFQSGNGSSNHRYINHSWVNVDVNWSGGTSDINDHTYQTFIHEIFHALGLGHAGPYNGNANFVTDTTDPDFGNNSNSYLNDSYQQTIMSYFSQTENTTITADFNRVITGMAADWEVLRDYYGSSAFTGDTVYGFNTNISSSVSEVMADLSLYADETAFSIIDDGGNDTLDFSGYSADQNIDVTIASGNSTR